MGNSTVTGNTRREKTSSTPSPQMPNYSKYGQYVPTAAWAQCSADSYLATTLFVHSLSLPTNLTPQECTSTPSRAPLRMAFFLLQTHRGLPPNPPIRNSTVTPTLHPPQESTSSNSSASPAPKRSPSTSGGQPVPSRPHRRPRAQPGPSWFKFSFLY